MGKIARKIGAWAAGLTGLVLTSGCASTQVEPAAVRPAYSTDTSTSAEPYSGPRLEESKLEESADEEGKPNKRPLFSVVLSFEPTYRQFEISTMLPPPPSKFFPTTYGNADLSITDTADVQLGAGVQFNVPISETLFTRSSSSCVWSAQSYYGYSNEKREGAIFVEKSFPGDIRSEGSTGYVSVIPSACTWRQEVGLGVNVGEKSAFTLSGRATYYPGWKIYEGWNVVEGLMNPTTTPRKIRTVESSGWGFGGGIRFEGSTCFVELGGEKYNFGKGFGAVNSYTLSVGGKF
jgi:hypothetical protein